MYSSAVTYTTKYKRFTLEKKKYTVLSVWHYYHLKYHFVGDVTKSDVWLLGFSNHSYCWPSEEECSVQYRISDNINANFIGMVVVDISSIRVSCLTSISMWIIYSV